ncbi:MAG: hypothetical protein JNG85_09705 [Spirochaetaceae bacterium]|nr:hypothetical protein [Spirochaetaceae bacterium]
MNYSEFHNHKWARNLGLALGYWEKGEYEKLWRGEQVAERDWYPGLRVMAAYWASVEHEMPLRLATLLRGAALPGLAGEPAVAARIADYAGRFLADMRELAAKAGRGLPAVVEAVAAAPLDMPPDWAETMRALQDESEAVVAVGAFPRSLLDRWLGLCARSVANYNRFLVAGATCAAELVRRGGEAALRDAVAATEGDFMWDVSRAFFATALPKAGFEDIGDLMELGLRGMYADQFFHSEPERAEGDASVRVSVLENCELAGVYEAVERWEGLPPRSLGWGFCRYCEVHGLATMMITMPPMVSPAYEREVSLGIDGSACRFRLTTLPADDMPRILEVQEKVFGAVE